MANIIDSSFYISGTQEQITSALHQVLRNSIAIDSTTEERAYKSSQHRHPSSVAPTWFRVEQLTAPEIVQRDGDKQVVRFSTESKYDTPLHMVEEFATAGLDVHVKWVDTGNVHWDELFCACVYSGERTFGEIFTRRLTDYWFDPEQVYANTLISKGVVVIDSGRDDVLDAAATTRLEQMNKLAFLHWGVKWFAQKDVTPGNAPIETFDDKTLDELLKAAYPEQYHRQQAARSRAEIVHTSPPDEDVEDFFANLARVVG